MNGWVYKIKQTSISEVECFKARLVVLGYNQDEGVEFTETFSPIIKFVTVRVILSLVV